MGYIFHNCNKLEDASKIKWDFKNVKKMNNTFSKCSSLKKICDFPNTSNVKDISFMFESCSSLESLPNQFYFDPETIIDMSYMFYNCSRLIKEVISEKLDINRFYLADKSYIFSGCKSNNKCCII